MTAPILFAGLIGIAGAASALLGASEARRIRSETERTDQWKGPDSGGVASAVFRRLKVASDGGSSVSVGDLVEAAALEVTSSRVDAVRFVGGAAVYVGLLGALFGLQGAVRQLGGVQKVTTQKEMESFFSNASDMLQSFGSAFWAAIAGVVCTLVVNAIVAWIDRALDELTVALDRAARERMVPLLGQRDVTSRAVERLQAASESLASTLVSAEGSFGNSVVHLEKVASEAREVLEQGRGSLASVRDDFVTAREGLSGALEEGARAMGMATDRAASTIGEAAAAATDRLRIEVETAEAGKGAMEEGARRMVETMDRMGEVVGGLSSAVQRAGEVESSLASAQIALRELAAAQRELGGSVHRSLVDAQAPVVEGLTGQVDLMRGAFDRLDRALEAHRDFVLELGEAVRDLPDSVRNEELALVGSRRLDESVRSIESLEAQLDRLRQQSVTSSGAATAKVDHLAQAVASLSEKVRDASRSDGGGSVDLGPLADEVRRVGASVDRLQALVERPTVLGKILGLGRK